MAEYKVVFEHHNETFRMAGVADSRANMGIIAGSVSSKGVDYTAVCIDYNCNAPLNDELYVVYTRVADDVVTDDTFYPMVVEGSLPSENDVFLYKTEKSAIDRVAKINAAIEEEGITGRYAVMETIMLNTIYNVSEKAATEEVVEEEIPEEEVSESEE